MMVTAYNNGVFVGVIILMLSVIGLTWLVHILMNKIRELQKPKTTLKAVDQSKVDKVFKLLHHITLEEKFLILQGLLGNSNILCRVEGDVVNIQGTGTLAENTLEEPDYTG